MWSQRVQDTFVGRGRCTVTIPVMTQLQDISGQLHAGCCFWMVDMIAAIATISMTGRPTTSINISLNWFGSLALGQEAEVDAKVVKAGRTLAFCDVEIR